MTDSELYINQLDYENIEYRTHASNPDDEKFYKHGNISCAGCGLCSGSMVVSFLTGNQMGIETFRDLAYISRSNADVGTDMQIYSQALADRFNLKVTSTDSIDDMIKCLTSGGAAIINVGGDHDNHVGIFSDVGHYIFAKSYDQSRNEVEIFDPAYKKDKYSIPGRREYVRIQNFTIYTSPEAIVLDTQNRTPAFYLFHTS